MHITQLPSGSAYPPKVYLVSVSFSSITELAKLIVQTIKRHYVVRRIELDVKEIEEKIQNISNRCTILVYIKRYSKYPFYFIIQDRTILEAGKITSHWNFQYMVSPIIELFF